MQINFRLPVKGNVKTGTQIDACLTITSNGQYAVFSKDGAVCYARGLCAGNLCINNTYNGHIINDINIKVIHNIVKAIAPVCVANLAIVNEHYTAVQAGTV